MSRVSKWELAFGGMILAISATLVLAMGHYGQRIEQRRLGDLALTVAAAIDAADVAALARTTRPADYVGTERFDAVRSALGKVRRAISDARFVYIVAPHHGQWRFLADGEAPGSRDYSPPGQVYDGNVQGFDAVLKSGLPYIEPPSADQWGVWVSGEAPIRDPSTGKIVAVLGIDVDARVWMGHVAAYRWTGSGISLLFIAIALIFAVGRRRQNRHVNALERLQDRTRQIMEAAAVGLVTINDRGIIESFNPEAERIFGYARDEVVGRNVGLLMPGPERAAHDAHIARYLRTGESHVLGQPGREMSGVRKNGDIFPLELGVSRMSMEGRSSFIASIQDITARKAAEESMRQVQKMETLGQLTGGVAHDFNNMLMAMQMNLEVVAERVAGDPEATAAMKAAQRAIARGAELTDRLLAFSRKQPLQPKVTNVNDVVRDTMRLLGRTLERSVEVTTDLAEDLWPVEIDPGQLANAMVNLAVNARDAMPGGGLLSIKTGNVSLDQAYAERQKEVQAGDYATIAVTDTGEGMTASVRERAFDPFFTTKPVGKGSGLGLSMVYGFVKQSGGHVTIESSEGAGTTVTLFFPRTALPMATVAREPAVTVPRARGETILLLEDDPDVRASVHRSLLRFGYKVHVASDGPEALRLIETGLEPDLLLADVVLPMGLSGPDVSRAVKARVPRCRTLFMSGYTDNTVIHHGRLDPGVILLTKPFPREPLALKIREALDTGA
ncbi:PAS domain S-box protein [Iodidimonas sp. SYSU 1G8]|uniref:PAS domain-containing sensor histidine kinase n=1 Tax=Iodidimonas sp. SYSU 1G8 TaxID=3133967 RepID=UPI0031FEAD38